MKILNKILLGLGLLCGVAAQGAPAYAGPAKALQPVTAEGLKKQIAARKGKVVVVNFWATWCKPCVEELPLLARWQKQFGAKGLVIMPVSADTGSAKGKAAPVLFGKGWQGTGWIITGDEFQFIEKFDPKLKDDFTLPRSYIYNRQGKLVKVVGEQESDKLEKHVMAALKK